MSTFEKALRRRRARNIGVALTALTVTNLLAHVWYSALVGLSLEVATAWITTTVVVAVAAVIAIAVWLEP